MESPDDIFLNARDMVDPVKRVAYLDQACGGDDALRASVEGMLRDAKGAEDFFGKKGTIVFARADTHWTEGPGTVIGRYKLLQKIGEGGMGVVYMAEQREPVIRKVALKIVKLGMDTRQVVARFESERQALALMDHPNIAKVLEAGATEAGRPYFVMELVRGIKVTDYCEQNHLSTEERLDLFVKICGAVQHAHQKGIIHRDLKPSNILVADHDGVPMPKIIDFGIAKATTGQPLTDKTVFTEFEQFIGTPAYMSPEQAKLSGLDIDTRTDIYSLGVLLYELLTGKTPFDANELLTAGLDEMRRTIREVEPVKPSTRLTNEFVAADISPLKSPGSGERKMGADLRRLLQEVRGDLDWIVMKCLAKDRSRRYDTANALATDVQRHLHDEPVLARPPSKLYEFQKSVQRHKFGFAAAAALILVLAAGVVVSAWQAVRATRAEREQARLRQVAETREKKSEQVAQFLKDILRGFEPFGGLGRDKTMLLDMLDATARRIGKDLKTQPDVEAELRSTLGEVYESLGQYEKAEAVHLEALAIRRKLFGAEHSAVAASLDKLARVLLLQIRLEEAETLARQALAMRLKVLGNTAPEVATSLSTLANVLTDQGRLVEAESTAREALTIQRKLLGKGHLDIAFSLSSLANILREEGKLGEAEEAILETLAIQAELLGDDNLQVAHSINSLGCILWDQGKLIAAEAKFRQALELKRKLRGEEHPRTLAPFYNLVRVLVAQDKTVEAERICRDRLVTLRAVVTPDDPQLAVALGVFTVILVKEKKFIEAEAPARECLTIREKRLPSNWLTFATRSALGGILLEQEKYGEAEPLLIASYKQFMEQRSQLYAQGESKLRDTVKALIRLYEATNRSDQAAEWKKKLEAFNTEEAERKAAATPKAAAK